MARHISRAESEAVKLLKVELEIVNAKNIHLTEENSLLQHKLTRVTNEKLSSSNVNVESQLKLFALEEERDKMFENLERLKAKYNKLHTAYLEKVKRCKALEEVFARQKTLPGLVKKNALEQTKYEPVINNSRQQQLQDENVISASKVATLQRSLDEAFDIIDELEFELESVDFLEMENERLKNELYKLKKDNANKITTTNDDGRNEDHRHDQHRRSSTCSSKCDECGADGLPDLESIERSVLTMSVVDTVQTESHLLRRELLRSRLQNTRPPQRTSRHSLKEGKSTTETAAVAEVEAVE